MQWFKLYYRRPRSTQEKRANQDYQTVPYRVRGKRRPRQLPDAWDDIPKANRGRGWKTTRQTQYKPVDMGP